MQGGKTVTFPVEIETGQFLEFRGRDDCTLYGLKGEEICEVEPQGEVPVLASGANEIQFTCESDGGVAPRAYVSMIMEGAPLGGVNPTEQIHTEFLRRMDEDGDRAQ